MMNKKGFTLIELLVVIAIVGLLGTISVIALNSARAKARDTKRMADVRQMVNVLEMYFHDNGHYPLMSAQSYTVAQSLDFWVILGEGLSSYISNLPRDPKNSRDFFYKYSPYENGKAAQLLFRLETENPNVSSIFNGRGTTGQDIYFTYYVNLGDR